MKPIMENPYPGLKPYTEAESDKFLGRESDADVLIDKILTQRLTLLFAASGVGKSSLLQAAVIPRLRSELGENLDVVYYIDWVKSPLQALPKAIIKALHDRERLPDDFSLEDLGKENPSLEDLLSFCAVFVRHPLVLVLDQFEEFFRYQKANKAQFEGIVQQLTQVITQMSLPVSVVLSMREDFALELNTFKPRLPTVLFENFYRLEKLDREGAKEAICTPVEQHGYRYEDALLEQLLDDLLSRELERQTNLLTDDEAAISSIEPPYLQIVCTQLWDMNVDDPDKVIRLASYQQAGCAKGLLRNYLDKVLQHFNHNEKDLTSAAFDHLVGQRGTKMAYTVKGLARVLGRDEESVANILDKLEDGDVRVLRKTQRGEDIWYELYHDMFSESIDRWNMAWKRVIRRRKTIKWVSGTLAGLALAFVVYDATINATQQYLRTNPVTGRIELYKGSVQFGSVDLFGQKQFLQETRFTIEDLQPNQYFQTEAVRADLGVQKQLALKLAPVDTMKAYAQMGWYVGGGEYGSALGLLKGTDSRSRHKEGMVQTMLMVRHPSVLKKNKNGYGVFDEYFKQERWREVILGSELTAELRELSYFLLENREVINNFPQSGMLFFGRDYHSLLRLFLTSIKFGLLEELAVSPELGENRVVGISVLGKKGEGGSIPKLENLLLDQDKYIRRAVVEALGKLGSQGSISKIEQLLSDHDKNVRWTAVETLGNLGSQSSIPKLEQLLSGKNEQVRHVAIEALVKLNSQSSIPKLEQLLSDEDAYARWSAVEILGKLGSQSSIPKIEQLLSDEDEYARLRHTAIVALGNLGSQSSIPKLEPLLSDADADVRWAAVETLGNLGSQSSIPKLEQLLSGKNEHVRRAAIEALVKLGSQSSIPKIEQLLSGENKHVHRAAIEALVKLGSQSSIPKIEQLLSDHDEYVRCAAVEILEKLGSQSSIPKLEQLLSDEDEYVRLRYTAIVALGNLGSQGSIPKLELLLSDQDKYIRRAVVEALGNLGSQGSIPKLEQLLSEQDKGVLGAAVEALGKLGSQGSIPKLEQLLSDYNKDVLGAAVEALSKLGAKNLDRNLKALLFDPNEEVRKAAKKALEKINSNIPNPKPQKDLSNIQPQNTNNFHAWHKKTEQTFSNSKADKEKIEQLKAAQNDARLKQRFFNHQAVAQGASQDINLAIKYLSDPQYQVRDWAARTVIQQPTIPVLKQLKTAWQNAETEVIEYSLFRAIDNVLHQMEYTLTTAEKEELRSYHNSLKNNQDPQIKDTFAPRIEYALMQLDWRDKFEGERE